MLLALSVRVQHALSLEGGANRVAVKPFAYTATAEFCRLATASSLDSARVKVGTRILWNVGEVYRNPNSGGGYWRSDR